MKFDNTLTIGDIEGFNLFELLKTNYNDDVVKLQQLLLISNEEWLIFDTDYKLNHAYELIQSRLLQVDEGQLDFCSKVIHAKYFPNWLRLAQAFYSDYNPIENYSMEEERTPNLTTTEIGKEQSSKDNSLVNTGITKNTGTIKNDSSSQSTANNSENTSNTHLVSPFNNPSEYVNNDKNDIVVSSDNTINNTGSTTQTDDTMKLDDCTTTGTENNNVDTNRTIKATGTEKLTRSGNIGVTTSQQMIESEISLRKLDIINMIYEDIDKVITIPYYTSRRC